jgi:hypothetical protein
VDFLGDGHEAELELLSVLNHSASLISNVLQGCRDVNFFAAFGEAIQYHVD